MDKYNTFQSTITIEQRQDNRSLRYKRLNASAKIASKYTGHSVQYCMSRIKGGKVALIRNKENGHAYYEGLITCGSVWDCPVCSAKISARRAEELSIGINNWVKDGGKILMVTYTIRHDLGDHLKELSKVVTDAIRFVHSGRGYQELKREYKLVGTTSFTELKYGVNGWHFHKHQLLFVKSDLELSKMYNYLSSRYERYINDCGYSIVEGVGVDLRETTNDVGTSDYMTKWGLIEEVTGGEFKSGSLTPFGLLDSPEYEKVFIEYSKAMKGKKRITYSKGLRSILGLVEVEKSDEELASESEAIEENKEYIKLIPSADWKIIIKMDLRAKLLELAEYPYLDFDKEYENLVGKHRYKDKTVM